MQLNYFGCLRVTMGLLPGMVAKQQGPRRQHQLDRRADQRAALLGLRRLARRRSTPGRAARRANSPTMGITFTTINMPLVRTPMIAPTKIYNNVPMLAPEEAADMIARGLRRQAGAHRDPAGHHRASCCTRCVPRVAQIVMNTDLPHVPGQRRGQGRQGQEVPACRPRRWRWQQMMRGIHF